MSCKPTSADGKARFSSAVIEGISIPLGATEDDALNSAVKKMKRSGIANTESLHFRLYKKSVDARHKKDIRLVYSVICSSKSGAAMFREDKLRAAGFKPYSAPSLDITPERDGVSMPTKLAHQPLVVGMGPAGLFCAYVLAKNGYAPVLIDRGGDVRDRVDAVEKFVSCGILDTECNVQFGAGGAGTFSDGKLLTRISDPRCAYVMDTLVRYGAPEDITLLAKPHVGTDILRVVVQNMLDSIEAMGGTLMYRTRLEGLSRTGNGFVAVTNRGELAAGAVVLAIGNAARDTFKMLLEGNFVVEPKPISVGARIEHLREDIDIAVYGDNHGHPQLGAAEYHLSDTTLERGVYTFCMCPGGEVMAAASEEGGVVVNGMSYRARDGKNSNSAVAVSVGVDDIESVDGSKVLGAIELQRKIERAAFVAGGGDYCVPVQTVGDFLSGDGSTARTMPTRVQPSYRGGEHFRLAPMSTVLPEFVTKNLAAGLRSFDRKLKGFASPDAVLSAAETRTSSPVRIMRGENLCAVGNAGVYPCGEGAGYAGGITSAAVDGIKVAQAIMKSYDPSDLR